MSFDWHNVRYQKPAWHLESGERALVYGQLKRHQIPTSAEDRACSAEDILAIVKKARVIGHAQRKPVNVHVRLEFGKLPEIARAATAPLPVSCSAQLWEVLKPLLMDRALHATVMDWAEPRPDRSQRIGLIGGLCTGAAAVAVGLLAAPGAALLAGGLSLVGGLALVGMGVRWYRSAQAQQQQQWVHGLWSQTLIQVDVGRQPLLTIVRSQRVGGQLETQLLLNEDHKKPYVWGDGGLREKPTQSGQEVRVREEGVVQYLKDRSPFLPEPVQFSSNSFVTLTPPPPGAGGAQLTRVG